ncbi:MAG: peptidoglycan DL-endopeptidase CwlO [Frankiaceae bacterium]|nr:peptidoglycan DL-endopeptidase CwlO [Frankiaceae bacterium]
MVVAVLAPLAAGQAVADPIQDARTRAADIQRQVDKLRVDAEIATEAYDKAQAALGDAVTAYISGQQVLEQAQQQADDAQALAAGRIVALYQSGGTVGIYSDVLSGGDPSEMYDRITMANTVIADDQSVIAAGTAALARVAAQQTALATLHDRQLALQREAGSRADAARAATDKAEGVLAAADATVQRLVAEKEAADARAAAIEFQRRLDAARAAAALAGLQTGAAPTAVAAAAIAAAKTKLGVPYVWGATGPDTFDCSGLTQWAYAQAGFSLPRTAAEQYLAGRRVDLAAHAPGDLLFWAYDVTNLSTIHHVTMYLGNGLMIAAPHTGTVVQIQQVYGGSEFVGAVRPTG